MFRLQTELGKSKTLGHGFRLTWYFVAHKTNQRSKTMKIRVKLNKEKHEKLLEELKSNPNLLNDMRKEKMRAEQKKSRRRLPRRKSLRGWMQRSGSEKDLGDSFATFNSSLSSTMNSSISTLDGTDLVQQYEDIIKSEGSTEIGDLEGYIDLVPEKEEEEEPAPAARPTREPKTNTTKTSLDDFLNSSKKKEKRPLSSSRSVGDMPSLNSSAREQLRRKSLSNISHDVFEAYDQILRDFNDIDVSVSGVGWD